jgi:hypothetical protein
MGFSQSGLGYGGESGGGPGILASVALSFGLYAGDQNTVGLYTNGAVPTGSGIATGLTFNGGTFNCTLTYTASTNTLAFTMQSTGGGPTFSHSWTENLASIVGSNTAYFGFTGSTGGVTAIQQITKWTL